MHSSSDKSLRSTPFSLALCLPCLFAAMDPFSALAEFGIKIFGADLLIGIITSVFSGSILHTNCRSLWLIMGCITPIVKRL